MRARGGALALWTVLSLPAHAGPSDAVRIDLHGDAEVTRRDVKLGDIASIRDADDARGRRLAALPIGSVPLSGTPVAVTRPMLSAWIERRIGLKSEQIEWDGAASMRVHLAMSRIAGDFIGQRALAALRAELNANEMRCAISLTRAPADVDVPAGALTMNVRQIDPPSLQDAAGDRFLSRHRSAWVDLSVDGVFVRTVPVDFDVSVFAPTYVAARNLRVGQIIDPIRPDPAELTIQEREWSGRPTPPLRVVTALPSEHEAATRTASEAETVGNASPMRVRRPIPEGRVLSKADVEPLPKVARGDYATLREIDGPIALESRVEVMEDGQVGDTVRVRPTGASNAILALVTGPHSVEVRQ